MRRARIVSRRCDGSLSRAEQLPCLRAQRCADRLVELCDPQHPGRHAPARRARRRSRAPSVDRLGRRARDPECVCVSHGMRPRAPRRPSPPTRRALFDERGGEPACRRGRRARRAARPAAAAAVRERRERRAERQTAEAERARRARGCATMLTAIDAHADDDRHAVAAERVEHRRRDPRRRVADKPDARRTAAPPPWPSVSDGRNCPRSKSSRTIGVARTIRPIVAGTFSDEHQRRARATPSRGSPRDRRAPRDARPPAARPSRSTRRTVRSAGTSAGTRTCSHDTAPVPWPVASSVLTNRFTCVAASPIVPGPIRSEHPPQAGIARDRAAADSGILRARSARPLHERSGRRRRAARRSRWP